MTQPPQNPQHDPWEQPGGGTPRGGPPFSSGQPGPYQGQGASDPYGGNLPPYGGGQQPPYGGGQQPPYGGQPPYGSGGGYGGHGEGPGGYGGYGAPPMIASKGKRFLGILIDWIIYAVISCCITLPFGTRRSDFVFTRPDGTMDYRFDRFYSAGQVFAGLVAILLAFLYFWLLTYRWHGQTLGKRAMGTRVVRELDGGPVDSGTAAMRSGVFVLLAYVCCIGFLIDAFWIFSNPKNQTLHDKAAKTVVVDAVGADPYQSGTPGQPR